MAYDSRCYDLAEVFLSDTPEKNTEANRHELAQHIQTEIEDWIEYILKPPRTNINECPSCKVMFKDGDTCTRGGCPMGGDF